MRRAAVPLLALIASCTSGEPSKHDVIIAEGGSNASAGAGSGSGSGAVDDPDALPGPGLRLPAGLAPRAYNLALDVDPAQDKFHGEVAIDLVLDHPDDHIWLSAVDLEPSSITITPGDGSPSRAGRVLPSKADQMIAIDLGGVTPPGPFTLTIKYAGKYHDAELDGLFREKRSGKTYVYSQMEATSARRVLPCLDEPQWKVPWQVSVTVPAAPGMIAIGNAPVDSITDTTTDHGPGKTYAFKTTEPLPTYLVAVAVGAFSVIDLGTVGQRKQPLRVIAIAGTPASAAAKIRTDVPKIIDALEAYFGIPLPFPKLDLVAIPSFPGAMENAGMITFDRDILLGSGHTELVSFAGHEIAHQWFGNLVTLAWWEDLWLNESFASWMGNKLVAQLAPPKNAAVTSHRDVEKAMRADADPTVGALRRTTLKTNDDIENEFDAIAYEKGAAVIAMFEAWMGEDKLKAAIRGYLTAHAGGTANSAAFLDAIEQGSDAGMRGAFATFVDNAGVPLVTIDKDCSGPTPKVVLHQERLVPAGSPQPGTAWRIPVCIRVGGADGQSGEGCAMLDGATADISLPGAACPVWVVGNAGDRGYYRVRVDAATMPPMTAMTPRERLGAISALTAALDAGTGDPAAIATVIPSLLASHDPADARVAIDLIRATEPLVDADHRAAWRRWASGLVASELARLHVAPPPGKAGTSERRLRGAWLALAADALADPRIIAEARGRADRWLAGTLALHADDLELVLTTAARGADTAFADLLLSRAATMPAGADHGAVLDALASITDPEAADAALAAILDPGFAGEEVATIVDGLGEHDGPRAALLALYADPDHRAKLLAKLTAHVAPTVFHPFGNTCDPDDKLEALAILAPIAAELDGGWAALDDAVASMDRCIARRSRLGPAFEATLGAI